MIGRRYEIPRLQSDFYRDAYRKTLRYLLIGVVIIYLLLAAIVYYTLAQPKQQYYANTMDGNILLMPGRT
jgi:hypothetical protein